jgi:hypothetical protein
MSDIQKTERMDMTPETKAYLDERFRHLEQRITDITNPIKETLDRYGDDLLDIFKRLSAVETKVAILEDNKGARQNNAPIIISIIFGVVMFAAAIVGFLL